MANIKVTLKESELEEVISALLFSSSVNIISSTDASYQRKLIDLAIKLKDLKPDIKIQNVQFIEEENYEDEWSQDILENFENNIEVVNFEQI